MEESPQGSSEAWPPTPGILDGLREGCQVIGRNWRYLYVNEAAARQGRRSREQLLGRSMLEVYPGIEKTHMFSVLRRCMEQRTAEAFENEFTFPDGSTGWFDLRFEPVPEGVFILSLEVTERKRDTAALREAEERYRTLVESLPVVTYTAALDEVGTILYVSPQIEDLLGVTPADYVADPHARRRMLHPVDRDRAMAALARSHDTRQPLNCQYRMVRPDGRMVWILEVARAVEGADGRPALLLGVMEDITERRSLEAQLLQSQKMESIGRLAGGVAHDFNNLLTGIRGFAGFARQALEAGSQAHEDLTEVLALADRAADLTRQLLAFSRRQALEPIVLSLNALVEGQTRMLTRLLGEHIDVCFKPAGDLGNVRADPGQIEQVIMNLAVNARDAMPQGGKLTIETANVELGQEYARNHVGVTAGPYVLIAVSDTGCGIDEASRQRLFEPFFTTKRHGVGTGLGLSTVYGIVNQHGGNIWVYSEPGEGTTFKVYLPRVTDAVQERPSPSEFITGGEETILVVEDDEAVRDVGRRHLEALGYTVLCASDAAEAEQLAREHGAPIDLLLTDVVMPDRSGPELYECLAASQAGLRVLYMSGYTDSSIVHHGVLGAGVPFLQKPFERDDLAAKLRQALDG